jgi:hypothetical protein
MDVITRLASWLYCRSREYREGLELLRELKVDLGDTAFFEVAVPGKIHQSLMWRKLADYARVHNIRPALAVLSGEGANPKEAKPSKSEFISSPIYNLGERQLVNDNW